MGLMDYSAQFKEPSFHSCISPKNKIMRKILEPTSVVVRCGPCTRSGSGKRSTTSTSKIKKMSARRKNRREKGVRAEPFGSNPHSYGEPFSRFWKKLSDRSEPIVIRIIEIIKEIIKNIKGCSIVTEGVPPRFNLKG